jgi:hypothetical protein
MDSAWLMALVVWVNFWSPGVVATGTKKGARAQRSDSGAISSHRDHCDRASSNETRGENQRVYTHTLGTMQFARRQRSQGWAGLCLAVQAGLADRDGKRDRGSRKGFDRRENYWHSLPNRRNTFCCSALVAVRGSRSRGGISSEWMCCVSGRS